MKKIKFISILLAGMIITIDSVRLGAERVKICYKVGGEGHNYKKNKAIDENDTFFEDISFEDLGEKINAQQATIDGLDEIKTIELKGTVEKLIGKINGKIESKYQVLAVQRQSPCTILLDQKLDLSNCSFKTGDRSLWIYLVPKLEINPLLNPKTESKRSEYPRVHSFCLTIFLILFIGGICLYHNPSTLKGGKLERKGSWKCRWKAINAMRLSRKLGFFLIAIVFIVYVNQIFYVAPFGGYYYFLIDLIFNLLLSFLIKLRRNDTKLSKWWLVPMVVPIIYEFIVVIFSLKKFKTIFSITIGIVCLSILSSLYILVSPSIPDEKKKATKEKKKEKDAFINSTTDIAN